MSGKSKKRVRSMPAPDTPPGAWGPPPAVPDDPAMLRDPDYLQKLADEEKARLDSFIAPKFGEGYVSALQAKELRAIVREQAARSIEALRLYEPLEVQEAFHASRARVRLARGSNRSGKTLSAAVEAARATTAADPHKKYPAAGGRLFAVGKDLKHIGQVMWRKLGRAGAFKIIRDEDTNQWRAFRPWWTYDHAYREKAKEAPPLIPPRLIQSISWESKKDNQPKMVRLHNGWELSFFSSEGIPPQGADIDAFWFDEEIVHSEWFPEMSARVLDRSGRGWWSATPQAGTDQLFELHEKAQRERELGVADPGVEEFVVLLADNPHITAENKRKFAESLSLEEHLVRVGGEFASSRFKVYPEFNMLLHGVDRQLPDTTWEEATRLWTRYAVVDPGHQVCAVLFAAVPPPEEGEFVYLEDELYLRECNAGLFAERMEQKCQGKQFQAFLMDSHMGVHTELGVGRTVAVQYADALRGKRVSSVATGSGFLLASDNLEAGVLAVHSLLQVRADGTTRLRVVRGSLPNLEWEFKRYHNRKVRGHVVDKPDQRKDNHLMDCLRYLAMFNPKYVRPRQGKAPVGGAVAAFREKQRRRREAQGGGMVRLGPGREPWRANM